MARSLADEVARYRHELVKTQTELFEAKRKQKIVNGVPEKEHQQALDKIADLERRLTATKAQLVAVANKPKKKDGEWRNHVSRLARGISDARALESENDRLRSELDRAKSARDAVVRQSKEKAEQMQKQINALESELRARR